MSRTSYTFCVLRYVHDPIAGETLNVGVLLQSASDSFLAAMVENHYERPSRTFAGFDGERYRQVLNHFQRQIEQIRSRAAETADLFVIADAETPNAHSVGRRIWADNGLSYRVSEAMAGVTGGSLEDELADLFERYVSSQFEKPFSDRITEEQIWTRTRSALPPSVTRVLHSKEFVTREVEVHFDHAFRNGRWHLVQPVSFDLQNASNIQRKAATWLGSTLPLQEDAEARDASLYFVLQPPTDPNRSDAYVKAKNLLHRTPLKHEFYEPDELDDLAAELESHLD